MKVEGIFLSEETCEVPEEYIVVFAQVFSYFSFLFLSSSFSSFIKNWEAGYISVLVVRPQ